MSDTSSRTGFFGLSRDTLGQIAAGLLAVLLAAAIAWYSNAHANLTASYRSCPFRVPARVYSFSKQDTLAARRDSLLIATLDLALGALHQARYDSVRSRLRALRYDGSLSPVRNWAEEFSRYTSGLCVVHLQNEGDKLVERLQVIHGAKAYFEFEDANARLHAGYSMSKFDIGELAPGESRDVYLWTGTETLLTRTDLRLVYPDGSVEASRVEEATGFSAWVVRNLLNGFVYMVILMAVLLYFYAQWAMRMQKREADANAEQETRRTREKD